MVVCAAIRRVVGPLQVVLDALLSDAAVCVQFGLARVRAGHVHVRLPGDLTGPSATYALVARHPRFRARSQGDWQDGGLQHHGRQTVDELNYIIESRPEKGVCTSSCTTSLPWRRQGQGVRAIFWGSNR